MELYVNFFIERLSQTRGDAGRMLTRQHDFLASNIWRYALGATGSPSLGNRPSLAMQAAHALVTVFFGKANKNIALVAKGMTMYGNTIRVLSQSTELKVPNESTKLVPYNQFEDTAMTMYLLGIYEVPTCALPHLYVKRFGLTILVPALLIYHLCGLDATRRGLGEVH